MSIEPNKHCFKVFNINSVLKISFCSVDKIIELHRIDIVNQHVLLSAVITEELKEAAVKVIQVGYLSDLLYIDIVCFETKAKLF